MSLFTQKRSRGLVRGGGGGGGAGGEYPGRFEILSSFKSLRYLKLYNCKFVICSNEFLRIHKCLWVNKLQITIYNLFKKPKTPILCKTTATVLS